MNDRLQPLTLFVPAVEAEASREELVKSALRDLPPHARSRRSKVDWMTRQATIGRYRGPLVGLLLPNMLGVKGRGDPFVGSSSSQVNDGPTLEKRRGPAHAAGSIGRWRRDSDHS